MVPESRESHAMPTASSASENIENEIVQLIPALRCFARRFERQTADIEDLVQETLMKALTHTHQYQPGTALRSWLFTIMRNTFCTTVYRRKREPVSDEIVSAASDRQQVPEQEWLLRAKDVDMALERLEAWQREALLLVASGTSYEDAAAQCGCAIGTIKSRVNRARNELSAQLGEPSFTDVYSIH
jgi:RNA polymerase sigma-70 factor (ECF subfamily)